MSDQLVLGNFHFGLQGGKGAAYQQLQRRSSERWVNQDRVGTRASHQHLGAGDDDLTLSGVVHPEINGVAALTAMAQLRAIKESGKAQFLILIDDQKQGDITGQWFVLDVEETQTELLGNIPRKIEFNLKLRFYGGDRERGLYR